MSESAPAPQWADSSRGLGRWIERLIGIRLLRRPLVFSSRQLIIRTAERNGIPWRKRRSELMGGCRSSSGPEPQRGSGSSRLLPSALSMLMSRATSVGRQQRRLSKPPMRWPCAFGLRKSLHRCRLRRDSVMQSMQWWNRSSSDSIHEVLDLGCSVGVSTQALARWLNHRADQRGLERPRLIGLDLSPEMLAVARVRDRDSLISEWRHAAAEHTALASETVDFISLQFVCHELPQNATREVLEEAARLLKPGGVLLMVDQDPASSVLQRLPAAVATLSEEYGALHRGLFRSRYECHPSPGWVSRSAHYGL